MKDSSLALSALSARKLVSALSVLLTAFGFMTAFTVLQTGSAIEQRIARDSRAADIVIGAKGSPLQLVLSSVYHADIPVGNIAYADAQKWMKHPHITSAVPLALGDNWRGARIVGTTRDYAAAYDAQMAAGDWWQKPFEAVAGAAVDLTVGDEFAGSHGLSEGGHHHDAQPYKVVGKLKPTGSVMDRLILTSVDSVLLLHGQEAHHHHEEGEAHGHEEDHDHEHEHEHATAHGEEHHHDHEAEHDHSHEHTGAAHSEEDEHHHGEDHDHAETTPQAPAEITALLIKTRSPMASINLPRSVNRETALQAVSPALEMARLRAVFGVGSKSLVMFAGLLIALAALSIFAGVAGSLDSRTNDLAVLRALGYTRARLFRIIMTEGMVITLGGIGLGLALGMACFAALAARIEALSGSALITPAPALFILCAAVLAAGFIACLVPAIRAARSEPARLLSQRS